MNTNSLLYREIDSQTLSRLVDRHFENGALKSARLLSGGLFNTTYRLDLQDGQKAVLRLGPVNRHLLMPFEHGMMAAEAHVYALLKENGVSVPRVIAVSDSRDLVDRDYMLTEYIPSIPLSEYEGDRTEAHRELGGMMARMHSIANGKFGRVSQILKGGGYLRWSEAMVGEARDWMSVALPSGYMNERAAQRLLRVFASRRELFDQVVEPRLLHVDLWAGNVLVSKDGRLMAIIDADRCLFGDTAFDFAEGWLDAPEVQRSYGRAVPMDAEEEERMRLYRLLYAMLDGYVYFAEYQMPERALDRKEAAMAMLRAFEGES